MRAFLIFGVGLFSLVAVAARPMTTTTTTVKTIGQKTGEKIDRAVEAAQKKKEETTAELQKSYDHLNQQVTELRAKAKEVTGQTRQDVQSQIRNLEKDRQKLAEQLDKMKSATGSAWEDLKQGAAAAVEQMQKAIDKAEEKLK
jgi:TolA-binding protein